MSSLDRLLSLKGPYLLNRELDGFLISEGFTAMRDGTDPIGSFLKLDDIHGKRVTIIIDEKDMEASYVGPNGEPIRIYRGLHSGNGSRNAVMTTHHEAYFIEKYNSMVTEYLKIQNTWAQGPVKTD